MKNQSIISRFTPILDRIHYIVIFIILLSLSLYYHVFYIVLIIFIIYIYKQKALNKIGYIIILLFSINLIINYLVFNIKDDYNVSSNVFVYDVLDNKTIVKDNLKTYVIPKKLDLKPGDYIYLEAKALILESSSYDGDFDEKFYYLQNSYNKKLNVINYKLIDSIYTFKRLRFDLINFYSEKLSPDIADFVLALTLGKDINVESVYKLNLSHILVISGFHLSFIYLIVNKFIFKISHNYIFTKRCSLFLITIYSLICGTSISIMRALFMLYLKEFNEKHKCFTNLDMFSICFLILVIKPLNIYNTSFILSNLASFSLIYLNQLIKTDNKIYKKILFNLLLFLILLPVTTNFNNRISLFFIISFFFLDYFNYILIPLSFILLITPYHNEMFLLFFNPFFNLINILSNQFVFTIPFMNIYIKTIYYFILLILLLNNKKIYKILFMLFMIVFINSNSFIKEEVVFIDVKQGDSTYIKIDDKNYLIDCHNCFNYLNKKGVTKINYIFISHDDYDHMSDLEKILININVDIVYTNKYDNKIGSICNKYNVIFKTLSVGDVLNINSDQIEVISPTLNYNESNLNSLVLKIKHLDKKYLFTGDMCMLNEFELLEKDIGTIDILKVAHHGSNTSSSEEFIKKINPHISIVSVAKYNKYGLPNKEVMNRLKRYSKVYITYINGNISIRNNILKTYK